MVQVFIAQVEEEPDKCPICGETVEEGRQVLFTKHPDDPSARPVHEECSERYWRLRVFGHYR